MPDSTTTPGHPSARDCALRRVAFRYTDSVGTRDQFSIVAQWLACTYPCRRFADILAGACARLGADVVRYSFIVVDLHHLLLAGLPAHPCENAKALGFSGFALPVPRYNQADTARSEGLPLSSIAYTCVFTRPRPTAVGRISPKQPFEPGPTIWIGPDPRVLL